MARAIQISIGLHVVRDQALGSTPNTSLLHPIRQRRRTIAERVVPRSPQIRPRPVRQRRMTVQVSIPNDEPIQQWCICRKEEYGEMILCENTQCMIKWFHLDCLSMEIAPEGDWYCANCSLLANKRRWNKVHTQIQFYCCLDLFPFNNNSFASQFTLLIYIYYSVTLKIIKPKKLNH